MLSVSRNSCLIVFVLYSYVTKGIRLWSALLPFSCFAANSSSIFSLLAAKFSI